MLALCTHTEPLGQVFFDLIGEIFDWKNVSIVVHKFCSQRQVFVTVNLLVVFRMSASVNNQFKRIVHYLYVYVYVYVYVHIHTHAYDNTCISTVAYMKIDRQIDTYIGYV